MPRIKFLKELWGYRAGDVIDYSQDDAEAQRLAEKGFIEIMPPETPRVQTRQVKSMATGQIEDRMITEAPVERAASPAAPAAEEDEEEDEPAPRSRGRRRR